MRSASDVAPWHARTARTSEISHRGTPAGAPAVGSGVIDRRFLRHGWPGARLRLDSPSRFTVALSGISMRLLAPYAFSALLLGACASASTTTTAPGAPPSVPPAAPPVVATPRAPLAEAPPDWHLLDATLDGVPGISARRAERELLAGKQPQRTITPSSPSMDGSARRTTTNARTT